MARSSYSTITLRVCAVFACLVIFAACKGGSAESFPIDTSAPAIQKNETKPLLSKFARTQLDEHKALVAKQRADLAKMTHDQKDEFKKWNGEAKKKLIQLHHEHRGEGKLVRAEVKNERQQRTALLKSQAEALKKLREDQDKERKSLDAFQDANMQMFKNHLDRSLRPPASLWPTGTSPY